MNKWYGCVFLNPIFMNHAIFPLIIPRRPWAMEETSWTKALSYYNSGCGCSFYLTFITSFGHVEKRREPWCPDRQTIVVISLSNKATQSSRCSESSVEVGAGQSILGSNLFLLPQFRSFTSIWSTIVDMVRKFSWGRLTVFVIHIYLPWVLQIYCLLLERKRDKKYADLQSSWVLVEKRHLQCLLTLRFDQFDGFNIIEIFHFFIVMVGWVGRSLIIHPSELWFLSLLQRIPRGGETLILKYRQHQQIKRTLNSVISSNCAISAFPFHKSLCCFQRYYLSKVASNYVFSSIFFFPLCYRR